LADGHGLYLYVAANGSRLWRFDFQFDGKRSTMSFGGYPEVSLADAREAREAARKQLAQGRNPVAERKIAKSTAALTRANTFGLVADELLEKLAREKKAAVTIDKRRWLLKDLAEPLANRPIADISAVEILAILRDVERRVLRDNQDENRATIRMRMDCRRQTEVRA
jgi:hypothetical protein